MTSDPAARAAGELDTAQQRSDVAALGTHAGAWRRADAHERAARSERTRRLYAANAT